MQINDLTANEKALLLSFAYCEMSATNGSPKHAQSARDLDTYIWLSEREAGAARSNAAKRAVLGHLISKGLVTVFNEKDPNESTLNFTDLGYQLVKEAIQA